MKQPNEMRELRIIGGVIGLIGWGIVAYFNIWIAIGMFIAIWGNNISEANK